MLPLLGLIVFLGVYPKPVLERMQPAVDRLIEHVEIHSCDADGRCVLRAAGRRRREDEDE